MEFWVAIATLLMSIIMIIITKVSFDNALTSIDKNIVATVAQLLFEMFATSITLAGTKIALVFSAKKERQESK